MRVLETASNFIRKNRTGKVVSHLTLLGLIEFLITNNLRFTFRKVNIGEKLIISFEVIHQTEYDHQQIELVINPDKPLEPQLQSLIDALPQSIKEVSDGK